MKVGDKIQVKNGASLWMKDRNYWLDDMPDSIDGLSGVIEADYTNLKGDDSHFGCCLEKGQWFVGVHPMWLVVIDE